MQEMRLEREMERQQSSLTQDHGRKPSTGFLTVPMSTPIPETPMESERVRHLSDEQVQALELENVEKLKEYEATQQQVDRAMASLLEIANLQTQLASHLVTQSRETERLYAEATMTTDHVRQGNEQLLQAGKTNSETRKYVLSMIIVASFILLFLDWFE
jgi:syntaxin 18